jgi:hypothetical protein
VARGDTVGWLLQDARAAHDLALRAQMADEADEREGQTAGEGEGEGEGKREGEGGSVLKDSAVGAASAGHPVEPPKVIANCLSAVYALPGHPYESS